MATVTKTWVFASDAEGIEGTNTSWLSSDGDPNNGCLKYIGGGSARVAYKTSTSDTWETWGVPAGATVTAVQVTAWKRKTPTRSRYSGQFYLYLADSSLSVITTLLGLQIMAAVLSSWTAQTAGASQNITESYQASNTSVRLYFCWPFGGETDTGEVRLDSIELTITYTEGGGGGSAVPAIMNSYRQRRN
jgi:hypothetical protein